MIISSNKNTRAAAQTEPRSDEMTVQNLNETNSKPAESKGNLTGGIILISIGLGLLVFKWFSLEMIFPMILGMVFILAGILNRSAGLLIPGGIIGGVGLGMLAMEYKLFAPMGTTEGGGVFLVAMSIGWFSIILLSKLFTDEPQIWPVFPGTAMAVIGGLIMMGEAGLKMLELLSTYWPLFLVAAGASLLFKWRKTQK
jgi:hypothetical protein